MRLIVRLTLMLSIAALAPGLAPVRAAPAPAKHPLIGYWRLSLDGQCAETYRFRDDGTSLVTSAREVSESAYAVGLKPSAKGFYKLEDKVVKDNGKPDCSGAVTRVGSKAVNFLQFHPSGDMFIMCASETLDQCIGPFERIVGEEI